MKVKLQMQLVFVVDFNKKTRFYNTLDGHCVEGSVTVAQHTAFALEPWSSVSQWNYGPNTQTHNLTEKFTSEENSSAVKILPK